MIFLNIKKNHLQTTLLWVGKKVCESSMNSFHSMYTTVRLQKYKIIRNETRKKNLPVVVTELDLPDLF